MRKISRLWTLALPFFALSVGADNWLKWQGPDQNAMSNETVLLFEWPSEGPELGWLVGNLGCGVSPPSIVDGRIFGMSHLGDGEVVWALPEKGGRELWMTRLGPARQQGLRQSQEGQGAAQTVDVSFLNVVELSRNVVSLKIEDGSEVWRGELVVDFGVIVSTWSFRESPLIDGGKVVLTKVTR